MRRSRTAIRSLACLLALASLLAACASARRAAAPAVRGKVIHPLDALATDELLAASNAAKKHASFPKGGAFASIALREPDKITVRAFDAGSGPRPAREADVVVMDIANNRLFEAIARLSAVAGEDAKITRWNERKGAQAGVLSTEYARYSSIVLSDPGFQAALAKRGIRDLEKVVVEGWAPGENVPKRLRSRRLMRGVAYVKDDGPNWYGRPIEGLIATVDMNAGKVIELWDDPGAPVPPVESNRQVGAKGAPSLRAGLRPLRISQPEGASFTIEGGAVRWQNWRFRVSMHPRDGLVLRDVVYEDQGRARPILWRASVSEMSVPYGDPSRVWAWRNALDQGEYGLGRMSVALDQDAPSNAVLLDAVFADEAGAPYLAANRIAIYERDGGALWRHTWESTGVSDVRRSRELVVFFVAVIGNYDYGVHWIFRQDGSIESELSASGVMLPKAVPAAAAASAPGEGHADHVVDVGVSAPHHQHFVNYRLDFDVDGTANSVSEIDAVSAPLGPNNVYLNGMAMQERGLPTERTAKRDGDAPATRKWRVQNRGVRNSLGYASSFLLVPGENGSPLARPGASSRKRAGFIDRQFWATRFKRGEMYAAGEYPNQSAPGEGLPKYSRDDEGLVDQDVVVWYTLGLTHSPRPEEWPVMPAARIGFKLLPAGFFERNPALDLPWDRP